MSHPWCSWSKVTAIENEWESPPPPLASDPLNGSLNDKMKDPLLRPTKQPTECPTEQLIERPIELSLVVKNVSYVFLELLKLTGEL